MASLEKTVYPVVPSRDFIVFPCVAAPMFIAKPSVIKAVDEACERDRLVFVTLEKKPYGDAEIFDNLHKTGTLCKIVQNVRMPDGSMKIILEGIVRAKAQEYGFNQQSILMARISALQSARANASLNTTAYMRSIVREFQKHAALNPMLPEEVARSVADVDDPELLCDVVASHCGLKIEQKQQLLETLDVNKRLNSLLGMMIASNELLDLERAIEERVHKEMDKEQHNYFLREQLKVINEELGEESPMSESREFQDQADKLSLPDGVRERLNKEIARFAKLAPISPESAVARAYIETVLELPWGKTTEDCLDISHAKKILEEDHYGLDDVKKRVIEFLAVKKRAGEKMRAQVICFVGPPGVGKTSLGRSVARAMGRVFVNISLGGLHDEAEIRGHRRTYVGALPGRIIQKIKQCGYDNPVILMDEIDKLGSDFRGDPASALLEALDPEQNCHFTDNFLEISYDLSRVMFITTANSTATIPRPLLDRMEIIHIPGYTLEEKVKISRRHFIPKILWEYGFDKSDFSVTDGALKKIIASYTMEAGVRELDRQLTKIARSVTVSLDGKSEKKGVSAHRPKKEKKPITASRVKKILGAPMLHVTKIPAKGAVGTAIGLAWTESGGDVLLIESAVMNGKGRVTFTGNLGDIMQESATTALAYLKSHAERYGLGGFDWSKKDIHIHVPEGAVPKDGPSAGITLALSLASTLTGRGVDTRYAMTGEMTLHGNVLPIGGLREKILAAKRLGIKEIIVPEDNGVDVEEQRDWVLDGMKLHYVTNVEQVFGLALLKG